MTTFKTYTDRDGDQHLSTITEWGSYPAIYRTVQETCVCPYCACERQELEGETLTRHAVHSEDPMLCDDCGCDILEDYLAD